MSANQMIIDKNKDYTMNAWQAFLYAPTDDNMLIARCDALGDTSLQIEVEMQEKRGGPNNDIQFSIPATKTISASLSNMEFDETWLSLQTGEKITIGNYDIHGRTTTCEVRENTGLKQIILPEVPVGKFIYIESGSGFINVELPSRSNVVDVTNYIGDNDTCLNIVYAASVKSKRIELKGATPPSVVMLVMNKKIHSGDGTGVRGTITVTFPRFQLDGNLEFAGALGDNDTIAINGHAQAAKSAGCGGDAQTTLGNIVIEYTDEDAFRVNSVTTVEALELEENDFDNIIVYAAIGSELVYAPTDVTADCTFVSDDSAIATVDSLGEVFAVAAGNANITVKYDRFEKVIPVTVI